MMEGREQHVIMIVGADGVVPHKVAPEEIPASLLNTRASRRIVVDFVLEGGKIRNVRPRGASGQTNQKPPETESVPQQHQHGPRQAQQREQPNRPPSIAARLPGDFHNPYNFIPGYARPPTNELGDREPLGHDRWHSGAYSGRIRISIETVTPLLLPDHARGKKDGEHWVYPMRTDANGEPYLAPTGVKGALRSTYEAITNSRFGIFRARDTFLARRQEVGAGLGMVPVLIRADDSIDLMTGTNAQLPALQNGGKWDIPCGCMFAAWLPRYSKGKPTPYRGDQLFYHGTKKAPKHGDTVTCVLQLISRPPFRYWRVVRIAEGHGQSLPLSRDDRLNDVRDRHQPIGHDLIQVDGWACITEQNIGNKHDERVFFHLPQGRDPRGDCATTKIDDELKLQWRQLVQNYKALHEGAIEKRQKAGQRATDFLARDPGKTAFSRHVWKTGAEVIGREAGRVTLAYAQIRDAEIDALFPVQIARELAKHTPKELTHPDLLPADSLTKLSPADRVFGWVPAESRGKEGHRGQLRVTRVTCTKRKIKPFGDHGIPIAILGSPKPQQVQFYLGRGLGDPVAFEPGPKRDRFYRPENSIRGRKIHPHQRKESEAGAYWDPSSPDPKREWTVHPHLADDKKRSDQNFSITAWVAPRARFEGDIEFENLNKAELGAMLWLLDLNAGRTAQAPKRHLKLGGGKPLGFGSVIVRIEDAVIESGADRATRYQTLLAPPPSPAATGFSDYLDAFKTALTDYGKNFEQIPFIAAYLRAAEGHADALPTHYPRAAKTRDPEGKNYEWFVRNDSEARDYRHFYSLPDLMNDEGLPYLPEAKK